MSSVGYAAVPAPPPSYLFFPDPAPSEIYTLSLHDALPILESLRAMPLQSVAGAPLRRIVDHWDQGRSEEHTSELQSLRHLVCRLLLEKKKNTATRRLLRCGAWNTARHSRERRGPASGTARQ